MSVAHSQGQSSWMLLCTICCFASDRATKSASPSRISSPVGSLFGIFRRQFPPDLEQEHEDSGSQVYDPQGRVSPDGRLHGPNCFRKRQGREFHGSVCTQAGGPVVQVPGNAQAGTTETRRVFPSLNEVEEEHLGTDPHIIRPRDQLEWRPIARHILRDTLRSTPYPVRSTSVHFRGLESFCASNYGVPRVQWCAVWPWISRLLV